ncbi:MAG: hypothetical protein PUE07_04200 [bacterium]|nr:hypothetical protein [bacterium]
MAELIDNKTKLLGDDLKETIQPGDKVSIIASVFTVYAFEELKEQLESLSELDFIFSSPAFAKKIINGVDKKPKEFMISEAFSQTSIYGIDFELKLRNQLSQKAISKECAEWIKEKVHFKVNISDQEAIGFLEVEKSYSANGDVASNPLVSGFSNDSLGYLKTNQPHTGTTKIGANEGALYLIKTFDNLWNDKEKVEDVTDAVENYIKRSNELKKLDYQIGKTEKAIQFEK